MGRNVGGLVIGAVEAGHVVECGAKGETVVQKRVVGHDVDVITHSAAHSANSGSAVHIHEEHGRVRRTRNGCEARTVETEITKTNIFPMTSLESSNRWPYVPGVH